MEIKLRVTIDGEEYTSGSTMKGKPNDEAIDKIFQRIADGLKKELKTN